MKSSKNFIGLSIVVIINLALQFIFQWYIIALFGTGKATDAFLGTIALPQFILLVLSGSLTMVLIPAMSNYSGNEFKKAAWGYFQGIGLLFFAIAFILFFTAQWWVLWLLPGFKNTDAELAVNLSRIQLVTMVFSALLSVVWAMHSAKNNFFVIETTGIIANIIAFILLVVTAKTFGIYAAAYISVLRVLLQVIFLMKIMGPYHKPDFKSYAYKETVSKIKPLIAGNAYYKTDILVDKYLTSSGAPGELTLLNLAQQLYAAGNAVLSKVLVQTMVPDLAIAYTKNNTTLFSRIFTGRLLFSLLIAALVTIVIVFFGKPVLASIFSFKSFKASDINMLWLLLVLLSGFWIAGLGGSVTSSSFYAKGNTITPTRISIINFTIYVPVKIYCYHRFGIIGLALSISIYYILNFLFQLFFLRRHLFNFMK